MSYRSNESLLREEVKIGTISAFERRRRWGSNADERDASILWPGCRRLLAACLQGQKSFVVGATSQEKDLVISRVIFVQSLVNPAIWHYGYLFTLPEYRGKNIGLRVMQTALATVRCLGGRYSSCFVARNNLASIKLNEKLGYRKLPFIRMRLDSRGIHRPSRLQLRTLETWDFSEAEGVLRILESIAGRESVDILKEEFLQHRPFLPWKPSENRLLEINRDGQILGFARCGDGSANLALDPAALCLESPHTVLEEVSSLLLSSQNVIKLSFFLDEHLMCQFAAWKPPACDFLYLHDQIDHVKFSGQDI
jgi:ribosomal protein S18 acetylase RimI-like enzyme